MSVLSNLVSSSSIRLWVLSVCGISSFLHDVHKRIIAVESVARRLRMFILIILISANIQNFSYLKFICIVPNLIVLVLCKVLSVSCFVFPEIIFNFPSCPGMFLLQVIILLLPKRVRRLLCFYKKKKTLKRKS